MSGHSKWANIRVKKTAQDARRGKIFTKHARLIEIAARSGGFDPKMNTTLRTAVENARAENVPNVNIERAIKKGTGALTGETMAEVLYAAYGPSGTAYLIECLTDNRNRTLAEVRAIIGRHGGSFADTGAVQWMFERKGIVVAKNQELVVKNQEELELTLIDCGAEHITVSGDSVEVVTDAMQWTKVRDFLKGKGFTVEVAGLQFVPKQRVEVKDRGVAKKVGELTNALEEHDDISEVYTNTELPTVSL